MSFHILSFWRQLIPDLEGKWSALWKLLLSSSTQASISFWSQMVWLIARVLYMNNQWHMLWDNCKQQKGKSMLQYYCLHLGQLRIKMVWEPEVWCQLTLIWLQTNTHRPMMNKKKSKFSQTKKNRIVVALPLLAQRRRLDVLLWCCICPAIQWTCQNMRVCVVSETVKWEKL